MGVVSTPDISRKVHINITFMTPISAATDKCVYTSSRTCTREHTHTHTYTQTPRTHDQTCAHRHTTQIIYFEVLFPAFKVIENCQCPVKEENNISIYNGSLG